MHMTPDQFDRTRRSLKLNVIETAALLGVERRTVQRWQSGAIQIPHPVSLLMQMASTMPEVFALMKKMGDKPRGAWVDPDGARRRQTARKTWLEAGDVTHDELVAIYHRAGGLCFYCRSHVEPRFMPLHPRGFDHVVPMKAGGKHTASNIVVSCHACNGLKN